MLSRRQFLALPLALLFAPRLGQASELVRSATYHAEIAILFSLFTFTLDGTVDEDVDRIAGRYRVLIVGDGPGIAQRAESVGRIRERRFTPTATTLISTIRGRVGRTQISYDHERGLVHYHHTSETFFLGRRRMAEDTIPIPDGQRLDDVLTAALNYGQGLLETDGPGRYRTLVVRRARRAGEGPDEIHPGGYRAEIVPVRFTVTQEGETGRPVVLLDLTPFSSWATTGHPARIIFGPDGRPESLQVPLILGTTARARFHSIH